MNTKPALAILTLAVLGASFAGDAPLHLPKRAPLTIERDGSGAMLDLPEGTPVHVLERSGDRIRVRVEGWIPASALPGDPAPTAASPAVPAVAAPTGMFQGTGTLEGTISLDTSWLKKRKGAGANVWLLPPGGLGDGDGEESAQIDALAAEMAKLDAEAKKALEGSNFSEATRKHDELVARKKRVAAERADLVASLHGRHEALAQKAAIASAVANEQGFFRVEAPPGDYALYARFVRGDLDVEWSLPAPVGAAVSRANLDETNARHLAP